MLEKMNELEKLGLAFLTGIAAGEALANADEEVEKEENQDITTKVAVGKIEGKQAKKFMEMMKELGVE